MKPDWNAAVLLDRMPDERNRTRLAAGIGVGLLLAGLLVAIGLGLVVAAIAVVALVFYGGRRLRAAVEGRRVDLRGPTRRAVGAVRSVGGRARPVAKTGAERLRATTRTALASGERRSAAAAAAMRSTADRARDAATAKTRAHDARREALRLNTAGSSYRRDGDATRAVETHLAALELIRSAGDRLGEALTLNNLGLALGAAGDHDAALVRFEEAHAIARDLDAPQYEGLIAANLAAAFRRRGYDEQAVRYLHVALEKLPADSGAYQRVEAELRRAS